MNYSGAVWPTPSTIDHSDSFHDRWVYFFGGKKRDNHHFFPANPLLFFIRPKSTLFSKRRKKKTEKKEETTDLVGDGAQVVHEEGQRGVVVARQFGGQVAQLVDQAGGVGRRLAGAALLGHPEMPSSNQISFSLFPFFFLSLSLSLSFHSRSIVRLFLYIFDHFLFSKKAT